MSHTRKRSFLMMILAVLLAACAAPGEPGGAYSGTFVLDGRHTYGPEDLLAGILLVIDGEVELGHGARVTGPVFLIGGAVTIGGKIEGDVTAIGGRLTLLPEAQVLGDVRVGNTRAEISPQAVVEGQVLTGPESGIEPEDLFPERSAGEKLAWLLPQALILAGMAYLAARFLPVPTGRVSRAATHHPVVSAAMGLLAGVAGLVFLVVIAFTLILLPVTALGFATGFLAIGYGWIGIGMAAGRQLQRRWRPELSPGVSAFAGTLIWMVLLNLAGLLPLVGDWIGILAAVLSLGAVLLTRFGLREFVPEI